MGAGRQDTRAPTDFYQAGNKQGANTDIYKDGTKTGVTVYYQAGNKQGNFYQAGTTNTYQAGTKRGVKKPGRGRGRL